MEQIILSLFNLFAPIVKDLIKQKQDEGVPDPTAEELLATFQGNIALGRYEGEQWKLLKGRS